MKILKVGDKLPNFSLKDQNGVIHNSSDYIGKKLIVFFYPKANTPGCTAEVCDLRDNYKSFKERGARYALIKLTKEQREKGVITTSAGNHAQALAYHGRDLGIPVTVCMPKIAPLVKVFNPKNSWFPRTRYQWRV